MPLFLRLLSYIVPARYYLLIIRGIMLKDVGMGELWQPVLVLVVLGTLLMLVSIKNFKTDLEK